MARLPSNPDLLKDLTIQEEWTSSQVADHFGVSRQAAHARLTALMKEGWIERTGRGPGTRYRLKDRPLEHRTFEVRGLEEDLVWKELSASLVESVSFSDTGLVRFQYAFTEMLNNAIEHAEATTVEIEFRSQSEGQLQFVISDDGLGIFEKIQKQLELDSPFEAIVELSKGKFTTDPEAHTGEGIFFTSKVASSFELESNGVRWIVDNEVGDNAILQLTGQGQAKGTTVRFSDDPTSSESLEDVFAQFTDGSRFTRTQPVVKLVAYGTNLISRSEARRLVARLEEFERVTLDFEGVEGVGQGFVDEVFRVFTASHPEVQLETINMNRAVEFMVKRCLTSHRDPA